MFILSITFIIRVKKEQDIPYIVMEKLQTCERVNPQFAGQIRSITGFKHGWQLHS